MSSSIVIVSNEADVSARAADILRGANYTVVVADNGAEALKILVEETPWLFIVGETLSDMEGHALLLRLLQTNLVPPCHIMLTKPYSGGWFGRWSEYGEAAQIPRLYLSHKFPTAELLHFVALLREQYEKHGVCDCQAKQDDLARQADNSNGSSNKP